MIGYNRTVRALLALAAVACGICFAQARAAPAQNVTPPSVEWRDVKSRTGGDYRVFVWVPQEPPPASGYPVIYVLDGNAWGPLAAEINWIDASEGNEHRVQPAVVVGIGYPTNQPFDLHRRVRDLTTPTDKNRAVIVDGNGGYAEFISFINGVVKPDIERRYPIDRTRQTLLGHSLGGLFVLRTLLTDPASFQSYVALSPSIWWNDTALLKDVSGFKPDAALAGKTRVYLGVGELEEHLTPAASAENLKMYQTYAAEHPEVRQGQSVDELVSSLEDHFRNTRMVDNARDMQLALISKGYSVRFDSFSDEDHFSVVPSEIGRALPFVLKP